MEQRITAKEKRNTAEWIAKKMEFDKIPDIVPFVSFNFRILLLEKKKKEKYCLMKTIN